MEPNNGSWKLAIAGTLWIAAYFGARVLIEVVPFGSPLVFAAAALPAGPFIAFVVLMRRSFRGADELERRIQLEAMAVALPAMLLVLMVLGLLEIGTPINRDNLGYRHVWAFLPMIYLAGLVTARRRYGQ